jgi:hypothetical protein
MPWAVARDISDPGEAAVWFESTSAAEHRPRMRRFDCVVERMAKEKATQPEETHDELFGL